MTGRALSDQSCLAVPQRALPPFLIMQAGLGIVLSHKPLAAAACPGAPDPTLYGLCPFATSSDS